MWSSTWIPLFEMRSQMLIVLVVPVVMSFFSCFQIFSVFGIKQFKYYVFQCGALCIYPWNLLSFSDVSMNGFHQIWGVSLTKLYFEIFFYPFLLVFGLPWHICWCAWCCPTSLWGFLPFLKFLFCYFSDWIISIDLSSVSLISSAILNLLLSLSSINFSFVIVHFSLRILPGSFFF